MNGRTGGGDMQAIMGIPKVGENRPGCRVELVTIEKMLSKIGYGQKTPSRARRFMPIGDPSAARGSESCCCHFPSS